MSSYSEVSDIANVFLTLTGCNKEDSSRLKWNPSFAKEDWIDSDPADIDDVIPTDSMMVNVEVEEAKHKSKEKEVNKQDSFQCDFRIQKGGN